MRASSLIPRSSRRALLSTAAAAGAASVLAACSGSKSGAKTSASPTTSTPVASPSTAAASPSATTTASATATVAPKVTVTTVADLSSITVTGAPGAKPVIKFPTPLVAKNTVAKALVVGKGVKVTAGQEVTIDYTLYVAGTDKLVQSSYDSTAAVKTLTFTAATGTGIIPGFVKSVVGFTVGSRVLIAITPADGYKSTAQGGIPANSTLIFVVDIHATKDKLTHAEGTAVAPRAGLPVVTVTKDIPTAIAKPTGKPPTALVVQPLIVGTGPKLVATGPVVFQYIVDLWTTDARNGTTIGSSWSSGTAATVPVLNAGSVGSANGLLAGLKTALTGATVGSRLLVVIPPALGYPNGNGPIKKTDTTVWCLDILDNIASA